MLNLIIGSNLSQKRVIVKLDSTPKQALDENGIDYSAGTIHLDGVTIGVGDVNKTFDELGCKDTARLMVVVKADAA